MLKRPYRDEKARKRNEVLKKEQKARQRERALKQQATRKQQPEPDLRQLELDLQAPSIPAEELTDAGI